MAIALGALSMEEASTMTADAPMERTEPEQMFDRGCTAAQFARYDEAVAIFTELLAREPKNWPALYNRALAYLDLNRVEEAQADFEDYIRSEANHARASINLSHLFLLTNRIREAQEAARHALHLDPRSRTGSVNLGHSLIYNIRRAEAAEAYRRAVSPEASDHERAGMIARMRQDAEEFRRSGWPEEKLNEMVVLLRQLELNPSGTKAKRPAPDGSEGFIGANLEALRHRSDFFTWFHLEPQGGAQTTPEGVTSEFKPSGPAFHSHVTLRVRSGLDGTIEEVWLEIARDFIDNPKEGIFACDLAKSFLRNAASHIDRPILSGLAAEIEALATTTRPLIVAGTREPKPDSARPLSPAARTFFGREKLWETRLSSRRLKLSHDKAGEILQIALTV